MKKILIIIILVILGGVGGVFAYLKLSAPRQIVPFVHDPGDYFVTDIKASKALLKTDLMILVRDDQLLTEITTNNHRIRNAVIFILRGKTEEELKTPGIEIALNKEITEKLNAEFGIEDFQQIFFNEFVIQ